MHSIEANSINEDELKVRITDDGDVFLVFDVTKVTCVHAHCINNPANK